MSGCSFYVYTLLTMTPVKYMRVRLGFGCRPHNWATAACMGRYSGAILMLTSREWIAESENGPIEQGRSWSCNWVARYRHCDNCRWDFQDIVLDYREARVAVHSVSVKFQILSIWYSESGYIITVHTIKNAYGVPRL